MRLYNAFDLQAILPTVNAQNLLNPFDLAAIDQPTTTDIWPLEPLVAKPRQNAPILVIFDSRVPDLDVLDDALLANAVSHTLAPQDDALVVITQLLVETGAARLAMVAHGVPGAVQMGASWLELKQLQTQAHLLQEWAVVEIGLYSCYVAQDDRWIAELERLTGARVAATTGKVGAAAQGGSWDIGWEAGTAIFNLDAVANYPHTLAVESNYTISGVSSNDLFFNTSEAQSVTISGSLTQTSTNGSDVLIGVYSSANVLLYWTIVNNPPGTSTFTTSFNLDTALGSYEGGIRFRFWQGTATGTTNVSSSNYIGNGTVGREFPNSGTFSINSTAVNGVRAQTSNASQTSAAYTLDTIAPTALTFTNTSLAENNAPGVLVATLSATNTGSGGVTYALVAGNGSADNNAFTISGNELFIHTSADFETKSSYSIRIRTTDAAGNFTETVQIISITNVNDAPTLQAISNGNYIDTAANDSFSAITGTLTGFDPDPGTTLTYGLAGGTVNGNTVTRVGNYGTLILNPQTRAYTYTPNATVINALTTNVSDSFTFTVSDGSLSATQTFTINITGANDTPTLSASVTSGTYTDTAANDSFSPITGTLSGADRDAGTPLTYGLNGGTVANGVSTLVGSYGTLTLNTATGAYTYTPNAVAINALAAGATPTDTFILTVSDGSLTAQQPFTVNLTGANDTAILSAANVALNETNLPLSTSGKLSLSDTDNLAEFVPQSAISGLYGTFTIDKDGNWSYLANSAYDNLNVGQSYADTFTTSAIDGTQTTVRVTINGTNDAALIGDPTVAAVTENLGVNAAGNLSASGSIALSDVDNPATFKTTVTKANGTLGNLVLAPNGAYTYTVANSAVRYLETGQTKTETFTIEAFDGTTKTINFTINGIDNPPPDTTSPPPPTIDPVTADNIVNLAEKTSGVIVSGQAEPGSIVRIVWGNAILTTAAGTNGYWSQLFTTGLIPADGTTTVSVTATDAAGNTSLPGTRSVMIDTLAPGAPLITSISDNVGAFQGVLANGALTDDRTPTFTLSLSASAVAGDTVTLLNGPTVIATYGLMITDINATSISITPAALLDGSYTVTARMVDGAGNQGLTSAARTFTVDTIVNSPTLSLVVDSHIPGDLITNWGGVNVAGLEPGAVWQYSVNNGAWVNGVGTSFTLTGDGFKSVLVRQTDGVGNTAISNPFGFVLDTVSASPRVTGYIGTSIIGNAEANATLLLSTSPNLPTGFIAATTANGAGQYALNIAHLVGSATSATYYVYAQDAAGNVSAASSQRVIVGTGKFDALTGVGTGASDLLLGGAWPDTARYSVINGSIGLTGQIDPTTVASGRVNITAANIDILHGVEAIEFTSSGYSSMTGTTAAIGQVRNTMQTALGNNSVAALTGFYDYSAGVFTFGGGAGVNATLIAFDANPGFQTNYEAFLVLGKTSAHGMITVSGGNVTVSSL